MDGFKMRIRILQQTSERLMRNVAIVLIAGFAAGCSADTMRFSDGLYASATPSAPVNRSGQQVDGGYTASVQPVSSGSVQRNELPPVSSGSVVASVQQSANDQYNQARTNVVNQANSQIGQATAAAGAAASSMVVQSGDSLYGIARRAGVSPAVLMQANGITDANNIKIGQTLKIPAGGTVLAAAGTVAQGQLAGAKEQVLGQIPASATTVQQNVAAAKTAIQSGGYSVKAGDSLNAIAQSHGISVDELKKANGLSNGAIRVGQSLIIPPKGAVTAPQQVASVAPQQNAVDATKKAPAASNQTNDVKPYTPPKASNQVIEDAQKDASVAPSSTGISQMRWPVRGRILSSYGQREGTAVNDGIDIMVPEGTPVKAAENGVVIYSGDGLKEFGNTVLIRHDNGLVTVYGHNSAITVQRGQKVRRGDEIAKSGMTGNAKSPKLHFEVRKNSTPVNPNKYLES